MPTPTVASALRLSFGRNWEGLVSATDETSCSSPVRERYRGRNKRSIAARVTLYSSKPSPSVGILGRLAAWRIRTPDVEDVLPCPSLQAWALIRASTGIADPDLFIQKHLNCDHLETQLMELKQVSVRLRTLQTAEVKEIWPQVRSALSFAGTQPGVGESASNTNHFVPLFKANHAGNGHGSSTYSCVLLSGLFQPLNMHRQREPCAQSRAGQRVPFKRSEEGDHPAGGRARADQVGNRLGDSPSTTWNGTPLRNHFVVKKKYQVGLSLRSILRAGCYIVESRASYLCACKQSRLVGKNTIFQLLVHVSQTSELCGGHSTAPSDRTLKLGCAAVSTKCR